MSTAVNTLPRASRRTSSYQSPASSYPNRMGLGETTSTALEAIRANKLRSLLTMLGIIIGVGAVIIMISLGRGASANVAQRLQGLGTNLLTITPGSARNFGVVRIGKGSAPTLNAKDADAIDADVPGLSGVSPVLNTGVQAIANNTNWQTRVTGVYPAYIDIEKWQVQVGEAFNDQDEQQAHTLALIGQ